MRDLIERLRRVGRDDVLNDLAEDKKRLSLEQRESIEAIQTVAMEAAAELARLSEGRGLPDEPEIITQFRHAPQSVYEHALLHYITDLRAECIARGEALERMVEWPEKLSNEMLEIGRNAVRQSLYEDIDGLGEIKAVTSSYNAMRAAAMKGKG